jgi:hypothetical protein
LFHSALYGFERRVIGHLFQGRAVVEIIVGYRHLSSCVKTSVPIVTKL